MYLIFSLFKYVSHTTRSPLANDMSALGSLNSPECQDVQCPDPSASSHNQKLSHHLQIKEAFMVAIATIYKPSPVASLKEYDTMHIIRKFNSCPCSVNISTPEPYSLKNTPANMQQSDISPLSVTKLLKIKSIANSY